MNYRNAAVGSVVAGLMTGCAYLPTGHSSRSGQGNFEVDNTEKLFVSEPSQQQVASADAEMGTVAADVSGLKVRKSKRGNMDSYVVRGQRYFTLDESDGYSARGLASWYGPNFHGRTASNGEVYDMYKMTAAHKTLPLPTFARVTHIDNGKTIVVKINDRGPFSGDRLIDLSFAAALELGMVHDGTAMVEIQALTTQELAALSGPKNKLGVEFYYDAKETIKNASLPTSELFTSAEPAAVEFTQPETEAAAVVNAEQGQDSQDLKVEDLFVAQASEDVAAEPLGTVVPVPDKLEYLEVVVPGRERPANGAGDQLAGAGTQEPSNILNSETAAPVKMEIAAIETGTDVTPTAQRVAVPLVDTAAVSPSLAVGAVPAVVAPKRKAESTFRYYIQAGVYADVQDAEEVAVDIVLQIPEEEVNVKPLKDSRMYRVTIGPIVNSEHAQEVAGKLTQSGLDNYTVKVNEI